ncbi:MAG: hypothetical protein JSS72_05100 [Armatimonadetes bacterium]|nr:hypothetical protein [Armatimonadota bacterium]
MSRDNQAPNQQSFDQAALELDGLKPGFARVRAISNFGYDAKSIPPGAIIDVDLDTLNLESFVEAGLFEVIASRPREIEKKRDRSTIEFPYGDLDDAIAVAKAVAEHGGGCSPDQLAQMLGHENVRSGAFVQKIGTARIFRVIVRNGTTLELTELGWAILQPDFSPQAKVDAFLSVPLYRRIFDNYRGNLLPSDAALEGFLVSVGVVATQAGRVRQAFQRSAQQAGFFAGANRSRLIIPIGCTEDGSSQYFEARRPVAQDGPSRQASGLIDMPNLPPAIAGILTTLPLAEGETWTNTELEEWLAMFGGVLRVAFKAKLK